jgi:hypothetical protein
MAERLAHAGDISRREPDLEPQREIHLLAQRLHGADGLDAPGGHDREAVDAFLDLGEDVRGQHHGHALARRSRRMA